MRTLCKTKIEFPEVQSKHVMTDKNKFPNAREFALSEAVDLLKALIDAVCSGDPDANDATIRAVLLQKIEINLPNLHPAFGDKINVKNLKVSA